MISVRSCTAVLWAGLTASLLIALCGQSANAETFHCEQLDAGGALTSVQRTVGGRDAAIDDWPWQVLVDFHGKDICGGTLIASRWVLTAAHCLYWGDTAVTHAVAQMTVRIGSTQRDQGGQLLGIEQVVIHPGFVPGEIHDNDIALLKLSAPVANAGRYKVQMIKDDYADVFVGPGRCAVVTGWGLEQEAGSLENAPQHLRQVDVPIVDEQTCKVAYQRFGKSHHISERQLCAGYQVGQRDACQGDSGGPLVVAGGPRGFILAGVVSWGKGCGRPDAYGVYTRVSAYYDWIVETLGIDKG